MASELELAWAAGIFEGEGCICLRWRPRRATGEMRPSVSLTVAMTDEDIVRRFSEIMGTGSFFRTAKLKAKSKKLLWVWTIVGWDKPVQIMEGLEPWLGDRRRAKWLECLAQRPRDLSHRNRTHCPQGHAYDEENTYHYRGHRVCKACKMAGRRARRAKQVKKPRKPRKLLTECGRGHSYVPENGYWRDGRWVCRKCMRFRERESRRRVRESQVAA